MGAEMPLMPFTYIWATFKCEKVRGPELMFSSLDLRALGCSGQKCMGDT